MIGPAAAAARFGVGLLLGAILGAVYDFLRPWRPKHTHLADLLFLVAVFWAWIYLGFAVCGGDIRLAYTGALAVGWLLWEVTAGRLLRPICFRFWEIIGRIFRFFTRPIEKMLKFFGKNAKKLLANGKKWFTMKKNIPVSKREPGGKPYGKAQKEKSPRRSAQKSPVH